MSSVLKNIPYTVNINELKEKLLIVNTEDDNLFSKMVEEARQIAAPAAIYREAYIEEKGDDYLVIDGYRLESRLLRENIADSQRVFLYVVTIGKELDSWGRGYTGILEAYWVEEIQKEILKSAVFYLKGLIDDLIGEGIISEMNPGSLADWPIEEQSKIFALLGDVEGEIGVKLIDTYLMIPAKSLSGLRFAGRTRFQNCQLCQRGNCPDRRVPYSGMI
ncbi:MAG: vitamin B12 dependent methionine synthase [Halanaerobiaceae bacterium]|nr:vitamin B12 dependent methionine synthase [Halanaerobiaceae bacterium]